MEKLEIKEGSRYGIGVGFFHVQKDHGNGWFDIVGKRRSDSLTEFHAVWPEEVIQQISRCEALEKKAESQRKTIAYWKQKDENKVPVFAQLNSEIKQLRESNQDLLGAKKQLELQIQDLNADLPYLQKRVSNAEDSLKIAESLNEKLEKQFSECNIAYFNLRDKLWWIENLNLVNKIFAWGGWIAFVISLLGSIFFW